MPRFVRLPFELPILAIYFALIVLAEIPGITHQMWFIDHYWWSMPFHTCALLLTTAIFTATFVIRRWFALLVPVVGILFGALLVRYGAQFPAEFSDTVQPGFASVVWETFKSEVPAGIVVAAFGILAAMHWAPRAGSDGERDEFGKARQLALLPPRRELVIAFLALFTLSTIIQFVSFHSRFGYFPALASGSISDISEVLMFYVVFTINRWWAAIFPALFLLQTALFITDQPGCENAIAHCFGEASWYSLKFVGPALALIFLLTLLAAQWARPSEETQSDEPSGENSINSSLFPAGSET
jgi:hypothetical protein